MDNIHVFGKAFKIQDFPSLMKELLQQNICTRYVYNVHVRNYKQIIVLRVATTKASIDR